jgi:hypothetical protein
MLQISLSGKKKVSLEWLAQLSRCHGDSNTGDRHILTDISPLSTALTFLVIQNQFSEQK